jgi:GAF domain-containing protein
VQIEKTVLSDALRGLGDLETAEVALDDALQRIVVAAQTVFAVTGAGLMLVDPDSVLRYVAASDEPGRLLEQAQEQAGTGPCVEALVFDRVVTTADLAQDDRWPDVSAMVVPAGVAAVLGVPVRLAGGAVGSLNVYCDRPHEWDDSELEAIGAFARLIEDHLAAAVLRHRRDTLVEQLQYALDHRVVVERAVGLIMGNEGLDAVAAFDRLRSVARSRRVRAAEVAEEVLRDGRLGT